MLLSALFVDLFLKLSKMEKIKTGVKLILFVQGVALWFLFVSTNSTRSDQIVEVKDIRLARTRSIPRKWSPKDDPHRKEEYAKVADRHKTQQRRRTSRIRSSSSENVIKRVFGELPEVDFPDLKYRDPAEVRSYLEKVFNELPHGGFSSDYRNPCWMYPAQLNAHLPGTLRELFKVEQGAEDGEEGAVVASDGGGSQALACLPYAYVLGQPKCGTSDLFERLKRHPDIRMPGRKEVRWLTRGEFMTTKMAQEGHEPAGILSEGKRRGGRERALSELSSIFTFTNSFDAATREIFQHPDRLITIDGGPHTFWWPTQEPDGSPNPAAIPPPQIIREMQPDAKFVITLTDPVKRHYSDYYFLDDDRSVVRPGAGTVSHKSAKAFHDRCVQQVEDMKECIQEQVDELVVAEKKKRKEFSTKPDEDVSHGLEEAGAVGHPYWFRASQICAHDRHRFGLAGWGRLSIGLYAVYLEKWLEHFPPEQFLVVRLEDYEADPRGYLRRIFDFLGVAEPEEGEWTPVLAAKHANAYRGEREALLAETETLLRDFFGPYNKLLADYTGDEGYTWAPEDGQTLRAMQLAKASDQADADRNPKQSDKKHVETELMERQRRKGEAIRARMKSLGHGQGQGQQDGDSGQSDEGDLTEDAAAEARRRAMEGHVGDIRQRTDLLMPPRRKQSPGDDLDLEHHEQVHDQHDVHRHFSGSADADHHRPDELPPPPPPDSENQPAQNLRGGKSKEGTKNRVPVVFHPRSFDIEGLSYPEDGEFNEWMRDSGIVNVKKLKYVDDAARQLCYAAFALDLAALKFLLYDTGIPPNEKHPEDAERNALHCLGMISTMSDAHAKSQVFGLLKGKATWLTPYLDPPLPLLMHSVLARDIIGSLEKAAGKAAEWLLRAGTSPTLKDWAGYTPLHLAAISGMETFVQLLLECDGVDIDATNVDGRTPLHFAVVYGHAVVAGILVENGADMTIEDHYGVRAIDVVSNPGPIAAADAKRLLGVDQRAPRKIDRVIHPERVATGPEGWAAGDGGWGDERMEGYETDMSCDVDQFWAHEISEEDLFRNYLARGVPVLIRGLVEDWPVVEDYKAKNLKEAYGHITVQVSDIPYAGKFGGAGKIDMTLGEYIDEVTQHRLVGGKHPWYVFKGHPIPYQSEKEASLVQYDTLPTPRLLQKAFERMNAPSARGKEGASSREIFVNAQWALGGEATGAPVHFHNTAWNALIYGAKKWIIYPPHNMIMSNKQILDFFETDLKDFADRGVHGKGCVQVAGDVMIIPESWGHGVLNIQESVAVATEVKASLWRVRPPTTVIQHLPNDNRNFQGK